MSDDFMNQLSAMDTPVGDGKKLNRQSIANLKVDVTETTAQDIAR